MPTYRFCRAGGREHICMPRHHYGWPVRPAVRFGIPRQGVFELGPEIGSSGFGNGAPILGAARPYHLHNGWDSHSCSFATAPPCIKRLAGVGNAAMTCNSDGTFSQADANFQCQVTSCMNLSSIPPFSAAKFADSCQDDY